MIPLVSVRGLGVRYGATEALAHVDLDIASGERLAIIGESGSGKSTFALTLAGLLPQHATKQGRVTWPALDHVPLLGRDIGYVFQDAGASLDPLMAIGDQIAEVVGTHTRVSRRVAIARAIELLDAVQLPEPNRAARAFPHQLSGGQRQRVAIAAAIAGEPRLLIADEATSALDTVIQAEVLGLLDRLVRERKMTLILITHDIAVASQMADRVAVFYAARLVEAGARDALVTRPRHPYTAALLATHLGLDGPDARPSFIPGAPPDVRQPPVGCRFAPRCPLAEAACAVEPAWRGSLGDGAACIHADEARLTA